MKILYLVTDRSLFLSQSAGAGTKMRETIKALNDLGHIVLPVVLGDMVTKKNKFKIQKLTSKFVNYSTVRKLGAMFKNIIWDWTTFKLARQKAIEFHPDIIYERSSYLGVTGVRLKHLLKVPFVLEWIGPLTEEWIQMYQSSVFACLGNKFENIKEKEADIIIMPSNMSLNYINSELRKKVIISGLGVNSELFCQDIIKRKLIREKYGFSNKCVIGYVGSFARYHKVPILIKALDLLKKENIDFRVMLIGEGNEKKYCEQQVMQLGLNEYVLFLGPMAYEVVPKYLSAFDIAVLPGCSSYIYPEKLLEYGAVGAAVVAPNREVVKEIIENNIDGLLFEAENVSSLKDTLANLITHPNIRIKLAKNFKKKVSDSYSWKSRWEYVFRLIEEFI